MRFRRKADGLETGWRVALGSVLLAIAGGVACAGSAAAQGASALDLMTWRQQLARTLQEGSSPRDWALGSQLLETRPASGAAAGERGLILEKAAKAAPLDRMVQSLWANAPIPDPLCKPRQPCPEHWSAVARLDPDNGASWLSIIEQAWKKDDTTDTEAALGRMAETERYNEHLGEAIAVWSDILRRHPSPLPRVVPRYGADVPNRIGDELDLITDEAVATAIPPTGSLFDVCRKEKHPDADPKRFEDCGKVARLMMRRSQTMIGRMFGVAVLRASHAGTRADAGMVRTVTWQYEQYIPIDAVIGSNAITKQNHLNFVQITDSEVQVIQFELTIAGIPLTPPDGWKQTVNGKPVEPLDDVAGQASLVP